MQQITQYYTANHPSSPLVVLHGLNVMYFKNQLQIGYGIATYRSDNSGAMLDESMHTHPHSTDFELTPSHRQHMFFTVFADNTIYFRATAWTFRWEGLMQRVIPIQRYVRKKHMKRRLALGLFTKAALFSSWPSIKPNDLLHLIVEMYLKPTTMSNFKHQFPVREVQMKSFEKKVFVNRKTFSKKLIN
jgi:hypothetical protein